MDTTKSFEHNPIFQTIFCFLVSIFLGFAALALMGENSPSLDPIAYYLFGISIISFIFSGVFAYFAFDDHRSRK